MSFNEDIMQVMTRKCEVLVYLAGLPDNRVKQAASALLALFPADPDLETFIASANKACNEQDEKQELTTSQKLAWKPWVDILQCRQKYEEICDPLWVKLKLTDQEYNTLQEYMIACVYTYIAPRRCIDFCEMRITDQECAKEYNVIARDTDHQSFVFNQYKTSKTYGCQTILIPSALWTILREWIKINTSPWLFHVSKNDLRPLRSDEMTRRLAKVFNQRGFGVNLLRHAYVSDHLLASTPFISVLKRHARELGHSPHETMLYKKHAPHVELKI